MKFSFTTVLFLAFLILKLTGAVAWSWWWVTAPLWGAAVIAIILFLAFMVWLSK